MPQAGRCLAVQAAKEQKPGEQRTWPLTTQKATFSCGPVSMSHVGLAASGLPCIFATRCSPIRPLLVVVAPWGVLPSVWPPLPLPCPLLRVCVPTTMLSNCGTWPVATFVLNSRPLHCSVHAHGCVAVSCHCAAGIGGTQVYVTGKFILKQGSSCTTTATTTTTTTTTTVAIRKTCGAGECVDDSANTCVSCKLGQTYQNLKSHTEAQCQHVQTCAKDEYEMATATLRH